MTLIETILTTAGINHRRNRFIKPPAGTYAVWMDDVRTTGADRLQTGSYTGKVYDHNVTIELYEPDPDDAAEALLESALDDAGLDWQKQDRLWLDTEQVYEAAYDIEYYDKGE